MQAATPSSASSSDSGGGGGGPGSGGGASSSNKLRVLKRTTLLQDLPATVDTLFASGLWGMWQAAVDLVKAPLLAVKLHSFKTKFGIDQDEFVGGIQDAVWAVYRGLGSDDESKRSQLEAMSLSHGLEAYRTWEADLKERGFHVKLHLDSIQSCEWIDADIVSHAAVAAYNPEVAELVEDQDGYNVWALATAAIRATIVLELSRPSRLLPGTEMRWRLRDERTQLWQFASGPVHGPSIFRPSDAAEKAELPPWVLAGVATQTRGHRVQTMFA